MCSPVVTGIFGAYIGGTIGSGLGRRNGDHGGEDSAGTSETTDRNGR